MSDVPAPAHADDLSLAYTNELDDRLSDDTRARVKSELEPGERLLWAGCSLVPPFHFGRGFLCWSAIALFLIVSGISYVSYAFWRLHAGSNLVSAGLSFLGFGGAIVIGLVVDGTVRVRERRRSAGVCNAVTDRRVIIWTPDSDADAIRIETIARGQIRELVRIERLDGSGTLEVFRNHCESDFYHPLKFQHIPDVRRVEQIVRNNLMTREPIA